jgi:hypothetical protein
LQSAFSQGQAKMQILFSAERRNSLPDLNPTLNCPESGHFLIDAPAPILTLCRELLAAGLDPDAAIQAYSAGILALRARHE